MPGPEFFQTRMGQKFFESDVPRIARALESIAEKFSAPEKVEQVLPVVVITMKQGVVEEVILCPKGAKEAEGIFYTKITALIPGAGGRDDLNSILADALDEGHYGIMNADVWIVHPAIHRA
jgi:hypothetical protein